MKTRSRLIGALIANAFLATSCRSAEHLFSDNNSVKVYQTLSIIPHSYDSYRLVIGGKSYSNVIGGSFEEIREKGIVCFKTKPVVGSAYIHVVPNRESSVKEFALKIDSKNSFGDTFGMGRNKSGSTYVDKIEGDDVVFTERFYRRGQNRYRLNLKLHTLEQIEKGERNGPAAKK